jgi:Predicted ICC-like phosphoesterases
MKSYSTSAREDRYRVAGPERPRQLFVSGLEHRYVEGVTFRGRAAYVEAAETVVIADIHLGRGEASDVEFPLGEESDLCGRLADLCTALDPETVVVGGDVLHTFGWTTDAAADSLRSLTRVCRDAGARPVLVAGNHDTVLEEAFAGDVHDHYWVDEDTLVCHGHDEPDPTAQRYIVGHDHPAIEIEGVRHPCFLYGDGAYDGQNLLILPAFSRLAAGVEVNRMYAADFQSPLVTNSDPLQPIVWDSDRGETLRFPRLSQFRQML